MKNIRYVAAECSPNCTDRECPYVHSHGWTCDEANGQLFFTPNDLVLTFTKDAAATAVGAQDGETAALTRPNCGGAA